MRKGFTMIELIFVIVILGVLASVAIPRLAATRDDAEVAKAATNLTTAVSDLTAYYTAKGKFSQSSDFSKFTNALTKEGKLNVKGGTTCVTVKVPKDGTAGATAAASTAVKLELTFQKNDAVCKQLAKLPGVLTMCQVDTKTKSEVDSVCNIQIGGSGGITF